MVSMVSTLQRFLNETACVGSTEEGRQEKVVKMILATLFLMCVSLLGCDARHGVEAKGSSDLLSALSDPSSESRADAAAALQRLLIANPSARTNDHGQDYWTRRVDSVRPGMMHSKVIELLPPHDRSLSADELLWSGPGTGDSHSAMWRLDHYWTVTIHYRNPDRVIDRPTLKRNAMHIWVKPPEDYTGTWVTWYVNGCKSHEIEYKHGKYDGAFVTFYDNEQISVQQHYSDGVCSGIDSGWYSDGSKSYQGAYVNGKQQDVWTHWSPDGSLRSRCEYRDGMWHGTWTTWRKDGKRVREVSYRNGKKHGMDKEWDGNGKLLWSRHFENGELMRSDPIKETPEQDAATDADKPRR